jgi:hypothetical protein
MVTNIIDEHTSGTRRCRGLGDGTRSTSWLLLGWTAAIERQRSEIVEVIGLQ